MEQKKHAGLLVAINKQYWVESYGGTLYFVDDQNKVTKLVSGSKGNDAQDIESMCFCNGDLYFNSSGNIDSLLHGPMVATRKEHFAFVCEHQGELFDYSETTVVKTLTGEVVLDCKSEIIKLCSTGERLFALVQKGVVVDALCGEEIRDQKKSYSDLFSTGGRLFGVVNQHDGTTGIFDVVTSELVARRRGFVRDIFRQEGILYDTSSYWYRNHVSNIEMDKHKKDIGLYETASNRRITLSRKKTGDYGYSIDSLCEFNGRLVGIDNEANILDILNGMNIIVSGNAFNEKEKSVYLSWPHMIKPVTKQEYTVIEKYLHKRGHPHA